MKWPLPDALWAFGNPMVNTPDIRCGAVDGSDLEEVLSAAAQASLETLWWSEGTLYLIALRPLLPDEPPCPEE